MQSVRFQCGVGVLMVASVACLATAFAAEKDKDAKADEPRIELFRRLAGNWVGTATHEGGAQETTVNYRVISNGSTVMETLFGGSDHEMVTMYHQDGDDLILTHYCAAGNQPRMKAAPSADATKFVFKFLDGTNLKSDQDAHMHEMTIQFVDDDNIKTEWVMFREGKPAHTARFDLKRKKA